SSANSSPKRSETGGAGADKLSVRRAAEAAAAAFPALLIEAERVASTVSAGLHGRHRAGPGETFWQHRPYSFGDCVAAIDWRQSARSADRLYVRQHEWESAAAVWFWRDPSPSFDFASSPSVPTKRRRADILVIAAAILLSQAGERVGLVGGRPRPFSGRAAPALLLESLYAPSAALASEPPAFAAGSGARNVFVGDFYAAPEAFAAALKTAAAAGATGALLQIVDPCEEDFPYAGRTEFRDLESAARRLFGDAGAAKSAYRERFAAHRAALIDLSRRYGWTFLAHRTDRPVAAALLALYAALERKRRG
ncbi:MAG: DUF58 domain-containing protein, partial [Parvularculaceae bacterium]|nr:DUF58 domain-containing protein [Parvularculaceae bacterium]